MEINRANLDTLFTSYNTAFTAAQRATAEPEAPHLLRQGEIAMTVTSSSAATVHAWLNQVSGMKEWVGDRVLKNLSSGAVTVSNRDFEDTVTVSANTIEDDEYGLYVPMIGMMGTASELLWHDLAIEALLANGNWADANPFFCSGRQLGSGAITNAVTTALGKVALETAIAAMGGWTLEGGQPAQVIPDKLVVGPALHGTANLLCQAELVADGNGGTESNVSPARNLTVRVEPRLAGAHAAKWYVTGRKAQMRPVCVQQRKKGVLTRMDRDNDGNVFMRNEYYYGTHARGEAFLTFPFLAYAGGLGSVEGWSAA